MSWQDLENFVQCFFFFFFGKAPNLAIKRSCFCKSLSAIYQVNGVFKCISQVSHKWTRSWHLGLKNNALSCNIAEFLEWTRFSGLLYMVPYCLNSRIIRSFYRFRFGTCRNTLKRYLTLAVGRVRVQVEWYFTIIHITWLSLFTRDRQGRSLCTCKIKRICCTAMQEFPVSGW